MVEVDSILENYKQELSQAEPTRYILPHSEIKEETFSDIDPDNQNWEENTQRNMLERLAPFQEDGQDMHHLSAPSNTLNFSLNT